MEKECTKKILDRCVANNSLLPPLWKDKNGDRLYHSNYYDFVVLHDGTLYVMNTKSSFTIKTLGELRDKAKYIGLNPECCY